MELFESEEKEQILCTDKALAFRGTATILLKSISFGEPGQSRKGAIYKKNVERLKNIFIEQGLIRRERRNHVLALVDENRLNIALAQAGLQLEDLSKFPYPHLEFPQEYKLDCLVGHHRLTALSHFSDILYEENPWWTVRLYLKS
jgi:hypothetical protein